jgi:XTP/dITP diphosphohydrolase
LGFDPFGPNIEELPGMAFQSQPASQKKLTLGQIIFFMSKAELISAFLRIDEVVRELREKCPWDRVQTKESLRHLTIEETYELADAVLKDDYDEIRVELGDLLLHILFYALLGEEKGKFDLADVMTSLTEKLIRRHPHIYGDTQADTAEVVVENWEKIKRKEKSEKTSILSGVPESLPALIMAYRMQEKASNVGFDWENADQVWNKFEEEIGEFKAAESPEEKEAEMGDILFTLVNYCRFHKINPDDALSRTNLKFRRRFEYVEQRSRESGKALSEMSLAELEAKWIEAKKTDGHIP